MISCDTPMSNQMSIIRSSIDVGPLKGSEYQGEAPEIEEDKQRDKDFGTCKPVNNSSAPSIISR